jgi:hypothetical protein
VRLHLLHRTPAKSCMAQISSKQDKK